MPSPAPPNHHSHQLPPIISSSDSALSGGPNGTAAQRLPPTPPPPPPNTKTPTPPISEDLGLANVSPVYRKEVDDWTVIFNPKLPRNVDIDLIQSIPHPRYSLTIASSPVTLLINCSVWSVQSTSHQMANMSQQDVTKPSIFMKLSLALNFGKPLAS
jgi:hypothetical protein